MEFQEDNGRASEPAVDEGEEEVQKKGGVTKFKNPLKCTNPKKLKPINPRTESRRWTEEESKRAQEGWARWYKW